MLLLSSLLFNVYAKSNDEKIQNTEHNLKNAIDKELEYLSKGINYDYDKKNNKDELVTKRINQSKNTSKDDAISKELEYLGKGINYKNEKNKLIGQIYLRADLGFSKLQTNAYNDNFCINKCSDKGYDSGKTYNFGIGWYINNDYRIDLLYNTANLKFKYDDKQKNTRLINYSHKVDISTLMLNLYRYKSISKYFDIYIGGGIGYTRVSPDEGIIKYNNKQIIYGAKPSNNFSYSLASGMSLKVTSNVEFNLGYRFLNYGKVKGLDSLSVLKYHKSYKTVKSSSLKGHNFTLGIIYKLPNKSL